MKFGAFVLEVTVINGNLLYLYYAKLLHTMNTTTKLCLSIHTFLCAVFLGLFVPDSFCYSSLAKINQRVVKEILKSKVDESEVRTLIESIREDGTWPGINYEDVSRTAFEHRIHLSHMNTLARAYIASSSPFVGNEEIKDIIELALGHWVENDYFCENWWHNQIGTPNALVTLMLLMGEELEESLVEKAQTMIGRATIDAPGARPGGDRIKIAGIQAKNALFLKDEQTFNTVVRVIEGEIKFSEWVGATYGYGFRHIPTGFSNRQMGGRGIQHDYSFHHRVDGVNNTLSYGLGYAAAFVEWAVYTTDTEFAFSEERLNQLIDYFLDGICKTAVFGKFPDAGAKNRSISRIGTLRPYNASVAEKLLLTSNYRREELQEIVAIRTEGITPTLSHATYYWHTEHFTFQRPQWFASVRMYSTRTHNMEQPYNSEGLLNHHRGDGANHLSITGDEYLDIWPVYDYQKIPGTTILQKPQLPPPNEIQKLGSTEFVGAATDGTYGASAFDFKSPHDPLIARKAWFFFDEEYVCLGTGISSRNREFPVLTTLNQSHLKDEITLSANGTSSGVETGEQFYEQVDWVYHDQVGYVFPQPTSVHISSNEQKGSWWRINKQTDSPKDEVAMDVFKIWLDHGIRPSDETYQYIVYPATTSEKLVQQVAADNISILSNTPEVQAVYHSDLSMLQAVFYQAGTLTLTDDLTLHAHTPGIVLLQSLPQGKFKLTVSDPNRTQGSYHLGLSTKLEQEGSHFQSFWNAKDEVTEILLDLPEGQYMGSSRTIEIGN